MQTVATTNDFSDASNGLTVSLLIAGTLLALLIAATLPGWPSTVAFCLLASAFSFLRVNSFLYLIIFILPLAPVVPTGFPLHSISTFIEVFTFVGFAFSQLREGTSILKWTLGGRLNRLAVLFVAVVLLCTFIFNRASTSSLRACSELLAALCLFLTVGAWIKTKSEVETILKLVLASSILVSCFGFYQAIVGGYTDAYFWIYPNQAENLDPWTGRITSVLNYSNSLAGFLNLTLPIALGLLLIHRSFRVRVLGGLSLACGAVALVLTASRGGFASFLAELLLAAFYVARHASGRKWLLIAGIVTAALGLILFFGFVRTPWVEEDQPAEMRLLFWGVASMLFLSSPIVGVGYGNFRDLYNLPGIAPGVFDVHNLYLQLLAETGLLGFFSFLTAIVHAFRKCLRALRTHRRNLRSIVNFAALGGVISLLLHGFVDFLFIVSPQFTALFWMILALVVVADRWPESRIPDATAYLPAEFSS
jgi:putative inorganic carbon (HCO3(-)) transporter